jgi:phosphoribosylformylglycinamidine synthase
VPVIVVEVMPKPELLDPAGKAVTGALARLGRTQYSNVRIGKRFELTVDGPVTDAVLADVRTLAEDLLANTVIEDVVAVYERGAEDEFDEFSGVVAGETH